MRKHCNEGSENGIIETLFSWEQWMDCLGNIPCAAYVVRHNSSLELLAANSAFYQLVGCTENDMRIKYGNCLGAILDGESINELESLLKASRDKDQKTLTVKQKIKRGRGIAWIKTELILCQSDAEELLCCTSFDISDYELEKQICEKKESVIATVSEQAGLDYFEYDLQSDVAYLYSAQMILPETLTDDGKVCTHFIDRISESEIFLENGKTLLLDSFSSLKKGEAKAICEVLMVHKNGHTIWARITLWKKSSQTDSIVVGTVEDVTLQKEATRSYLNETQFYQATLAEKTAYAHVDATENRITRVGGMWNLYNELIDNITYSQLITEFIKKVVHPEDRAHYSEVMGVENFIESLDNGIDRLGCEFRRIVDQNKMMWMELEVHLFRDPLNRHVLALLTIKNIDEKKKQEVRRALDGMMDSLTNLYQKKLAESITGEYLNQVKEDELCALLILNMDNFKQVNESYGHATGDQMLMRISDILRSAFRKSDIIGRYKGDQFTVFLKNLDHEERVRERLEKLYEEFAKEESLGFSCSTGVAFSKGNVSYRRLFRSAYEALFDAKREGENRFEFSKTTLSNDDAYDEWNEEDNQRYMSSDAIYAAELKPIIKIRDKVEIDDEFDAFIGTQGEIAYLVDIDTFELICGNQAFYGRLGLSKLECIGVTCYEAMHKRRTPCPFCSRANWSTDKFYMWKNMNLILEQEFLIKNKLVFWKGREVMLALAIDISNDKSIVDSLENGAMETQSILSGVQQMAEAKTLDDAMNGSIEAVGSFFQADTVRMWQWNTKEKLCDCIYMWSKKERDQQNGRKVISEWLENQNWDNPVMLENPEAVLGKSFDMYHYMKSQGIQNQRWIPIKENDCIVAYISIDSISSNFQNVAFMESFSVFIAGELKTRRLMERALYNERYDDLTDLLSRKSFERFMSHYIPDELTCVGVMLANFNNLKGINSARGFQTGNYYIVQFAEMLREVFDGYKIYRLNGDEFLVVAPEITGIELSKKIQELEKMVSEQGVISVAIGKAWDDVEKDLTILIAQATDTLKLNKKRHYDSNPVSEDLDRRGMMSKLVLSIENQEFEVFLQPKVSLCNGRLMGAEALIRYRHKELGIIPPAQFIDMLEKNNLIRYIDLFVLEEVCKLLERWKRDGRFLPVISLNFSRLTLLERDIVSSMEEVVSRYDVSKAHIEVEVTESIVSMGKSVLYQAVCDLYNKGYAISLDDFGTKYTNLSILADLKFTTLKIDRSLVAKLGMEENYTLIMKNLIQMCDDLDIHVIAEGIETELQETILKSLDCRWGQGYFYGKPMPIVEFEALIDNGFQTI